MIIIFRKKDYIMVNELVDILNDKNRPFLSNIFYVISGIVLFIGFMFFILPIEFNIALLNNMKIDQNITNSEPIIVITTVITILYIVVFILRKIYICCSNKLNDSTFYKILLLVHAVEDIMDFLASVFSTVFMGCTTLSIYQDHKYFTTFNAYFLYLFVILKIIIFVIYRIYYKNNAIFNNDFIADTSNN